MANGGLFHEYFPTSERSEQGFKRHRQSTIEAPKMLKYRKGGEYRRIDGTTDNWPYLEGKGGTRYSIGGTLFFLVFLPALTLWLVM